MTRNRGGRAGSGQRLHRVGVERRRDVPDPAREQRGAGAAVEDAIAVGAADRREPGIPALRRADGPQHHHGMWFHVEVQRVAERSAQRCRRAARAARPAPRHARRHRCGRPRPLAHRLAAIELGGRVLQHLLHREPGCLTLPADKWRAVVFQQQRPAAAPMSPGWSQATLHVRAGRPRSAIAGRPASCTRRQAQRPLAAGDSQPLVQHRSRRAAPTPPPAQPPAPSAPRRAAS